MLKRNQPPQVVAPPAAPPVPVRPAPSRLSQPGRIVLSEREFRGAGPVPVLLCNIERLLVEQNALLQRLLEK